MTVLRHLNLSCYLCCCAGAFHRQPLSHVGADLSVCVCVCVWLDIFMKRLLIEHRFLLLTGSVQAQQPLGALTAC